MDKIEVTQADRKAAASYHNQRGERVTADFITKGERDDGYLVQAFARHRLATRTDATPVAWTYVSKHWPLGSLGQPKYKPDDQVQDGWTEVPLYTHPPATDVAALVEAALALEIAVTFDDPPKLFNDVLCHEARVPVEFIAHLRQALAPFTKGQPND